MTVNATPDMSNRLYDYLCRVIVGSEDHVRLIRLMNASTDRIYSNKFATCITSGSFGEGLQLQGSDIDTMLVSHKVAVMDRMKQHEYLSDKIHFVLDTVDVKPGFAYLRLMKGNLVNHKWLYQSGEGLLFLSSASIKQTFISEHYPVVHGPCLSDERGEVDFAITLHTNLWPTTASKWITRSDDSWPTSEVKQRIIDHGVLFVPIGTGENLNEQLKWRISFSVGEKFLIYSFNHTQLLCYALMKILLKDVISESPGCKDLLCSYFIKTILFWLSEELAISMWTKDNLIPCFMKCVMRLIYCVEYSMCPHYFIPENNLFENKIIGHGRTKLLETLNILFDYGWRCIFFSAQISTVSLSCREQFNVDLCLNDIENILKSKAISPDLNVDIIDNVPTLKLFFSNRTKKLRSILLFCMTQFYILTAQTIQISSLYGNKNNYKQYKKCLSYLLLSTNHDALIGWLMLASLFVKKKHYNQALYILSYSFSKCTSEKLYIETNLSDVQRELLRSQTFGKLGMIRMLRILLISRVPFHQIASLIPDDFKLFASDMPPSLPPVAYLHFLTFLCHYHQHNVRNYQESLGYFRLTIEENFFISNSMDKALAYSCLGVAFLIVGDSVSANEARLRSIETFPDQLANHSLKLLAMKKLV